MAALSVSLGSLVVGFSSGYTSPALPSMNDPKYNSAFNITEQEVCTTVFMREIATLTNAFCNRNHKNTKLNSERCCRNRGSVELCL